MKPDDNRWRETAGGTHPKGTTMEDMMGTMEDMTKVLAEVVLGCASRGMRRPFIVCAICRNGSTISARSTSEGSAEILTEYVAAEGFVLPMTVVVIDQDNEVVRVTVTASGRSWH